jgi:DNA-binding response OmpR family regulator
MEWVSDPASSELVMEIIDGRCLIRQGEDTLKEIPLPMRWGDVCDDIRRLFQIRNIMINQNAYIDRKSQSLVHKKAVILLTETEMALMCHLAEALPASVAKQDLLEDVIGYDSEADTHTVESHIYRLRQKCGRDNIITEGDRYSLGEFA